jgi:hypothetical protein
VEVLVEVPASRRQEFGMKLDGLPIVISAGSGLAGTSGGDIS